LPSTKNHLLEDLPLSFGAVKVVAIERPLVLPRLTQYVKLR
jgi:hypothetical protein